MSREWTDVTRQYRRQYQFVAPDVLLIVRGLASGRWLALHAATTATSPAATAATLTVASIAPIPFTLALRCPNLHDMLFESLDTLSRLAVCKRERALESDVFSKDLYVDHCT